MGLLLLLGLGLCPALKFVKTTWHWPGGVSGQGLSALNVLQSIPILKQSEEPAVSSGNGYISVVCSVLALLSLSSQLCTGIWMTRDLSKMAKLARGRSPEVKGSFLLTLAPVRPCSLPGVI